MRAIRTLAFAISVSIAIVAMAAPASAAESYDSCTGFIDAVPTVITTEGTWCLRHDIGTAASNIHAIDIQNHNVTIDCNDFKLGNVAAGTGTQSIGIYADAVSNITVRRCTIQGFQTGISIGSSAPQSGHLIENNRLLLNRVWGILVEGESSIIRRNTVTNTGGNPIAFIDYAIAIETSGDVIDNVVDGTVAAASFASFTSTGISEHGEGTLIQGNRVRNLVQKGGGSAYGITLDNTTGVAVRDNYLVQSTSTPGEGILCSALGNGSDARVRDNVIRHYSTGIHLCTDDGGNIVY